MVIIALIFLVIGINVGFVAGAWWATRKRGKTGAWIIDDEPSGPLTALLGAGGPVERR